jgi:aryl-alcohol dehydrogenase-like predicted oxidoreductase
MEERRLGPVVGLGTWRTFDDDVSLAGQVVDVSLAAGVRLFDTSPMYGGAEASLGAALERRRDGVTVATKIWTPSPEEAAEQLRRQLAWYGHVELEQIHNLVAWEEHLPWLEAEREAGRIGLVGVTHYASSAFGEFARALRTRRFDSVQLPYSVAEREVERELLPLAAELGVRVAVMQPLASGRLVRSAPPAEALEPLRPFGVETWPQALLKWILSDDRVDAVIPATSRPPRAAENAVAGNPPWFGPEERGYVERLAR